MSEWISVKDRLPERDEEVLVYMSDGFGSIVVAYRDVRSGKWHDTLEFSRLQEEPIYWMPLPEPPEDEL